MIKEITTPDIESVWLTDEAPLVKCNCGKKLVLDNHKYAKLDVRMAECKDCKALIIKK